MTRPAAGRAARISRASAKHVFEARAAGQGALTGALDDRAVGERIAEGHAQFDHIRAGIDGRNRDFARGVETRIARRQIDDKPGL